MPIDYKIFADLKLVVANGSGRVTGAEVLQHLNQLAGDPQYVPPMKKFVDYRFIDALTISPEEAREIAARKKELAVAFHNELCALLSPGDVPFGLSRVHQSLLDTADINTGVFRRVDEAWEWLGFTSDPTVT